MPNERDEIPVQLVSQEPVDIENLLKLNPRIKPHANAVPSIVTKKVREVLLALELDVISRNEIEVTLLLIENAVL